MYDWIYYVALGLVLFLTAFSFTSPKAKDDQSEYTGNNPNPPGMKEKPKIPPTIIDEFGKDWSNKYLPQMRNPPPPPMKRPKTRPAPNPKPNC